ncbi:hypothetical protein TREES_T100016579 [Tupaia chinensis]|uniref:Uncharacterized protein n=1 Tax=Tupaia chinensis TaxID=246437 RepID=L9L9C4_TUPCH|nr:hypothetical protein TREES_T100016579 [Tupaia chinensis]
MGRDTRCLPGSATVLWAASILPGSDCRHVSIWSEDGRSSRAPFGESWNAAKGALVLLLSGAGARTVSCVSYYMHHIRTGVENDVKLVEKQFAEQGLRLMTRLCGRKPAVHLSVGASWEPEPAISFMQENSRDLEMRFLKVRKLAVESELQNQLE